MKTVYKEGMKVYDQLLFPDVEGVVTNTNYVPEKVFFDEEEDFEEDYEHPYPIEVDFKGQQALYKNDGSCLTDFPTLSTKPYEVELKGFEQKAPVPTFEEAWKKTMRLYEPKSEYNKEEYKGYPSQELADAAEALRKLLFLRDYYNEGWQPDLENSDEVKYCIKCYSTILIKDFYINGLKPLYFKSEEIRDKFLEEQRELLEIAKPLL